MGVSKFTCGCLLFLIASLSVVERVNAASNKDQAAPIRDKLMPHWFDDGTYKGRPNTEKAHYEALLDKSRDATPSKYVVSSKWIGYYNQDRIHPNSAKSGTIPKNDSSTAQVLADSPVKNDNIASVSVVIDDGPYYRIGQQRGYRRGYKRVYSRLDLETYGRDNCFRCVSTNLTLASSASAEFPTRLVPNKPSAKAESKKKEAKVEVKPKKEPKPKAAPPKKKEQAKAKKAEPAKKPEKPVAKVEPKKQPAPKPEKKKPEPKPAPKPVVKAPAPVVVKTCETTKVKVMPVLFEFDSAELPKVYERNLKPYAAVLEKKPLAKVDLIGHTDSKGSETYNYGLGIRRAQAVADYLIANGVALDQIRSSTEGELKPEAKNDAEKGRAKNRRVVISEVECKKS